MVEHTSYFNGEYSECVTDSGLNGYLGDMRRRYPVKSRID